MVVVMVVTVVTVAVLLLFRVVAYIAFVWKTSLLHDDIYTGRLRAFHSCTSFESECASARVYVWSV